MITVVSGLRAMDPLLPAEQAALDRAEKTIARGLKTFVAVGQALMEIRDARLYRATHPTYEDYLADRWALSKSYGNRLVQAYEVSRIVAPVGSAPTNESQARELAPLLEHPERMCEAWSRIINAPHRPTAATVRAVVEQVRTEPAPEPRVSPEPPADGPAPVGPAGAGASSPEGEGREDAPIQQPAEPREPKRERAPEPAPVGGPLLTDAEIRESLTDVLSLHFLEETGCRMALLAVAGGTPVDQAVARACQATVTPGQLPARIAGGVR